MPQGKILRGKILCGSTAVFAAALAICLLRGVAQAQVAPAPGGGSAADIGAPRLPSNPLIPDLGPGGAGDLGGPGGGQPQGLAPHAPDLLCVVFRRGTSDGTSSGFADGLKLKIEARYTLSGLGLEVFLMRLPKGADFADTLRKAAADKRPLAVQPDFGFASLQSAGDPSARQYALHRIRADDLPPAARGQNVTVAMIDSGVQREHESLRGDDVTLVDLIDGKATPPPETHGTAIASIIAGAGKVRGMANRIHLLAIRAFSEVDPATGESKSDSFHVSQAISLAMDRKARIINLSIGGPNDPLVRVAVEQAVLTGVVVIAAAGNAGRDAPPVYPAAQTGVIAVTATDDKDRLFSGANRGDYIAVAAPGVAILAARPGTTPGTSAYDYFTGTSMATGYVTGLAAVLLAADPKLTSADIRRILETSAQDLGRPNKDPEFGWGRIDAEAAFTATPTVGAAN